MKKKITFISLIFLLVITLGTQIFPSVTSIFAKTDDNFSQAGFTIEKYHISIDVNLDNTYIVTEKIETKFDTLAQLGIERRGIVRYFPEKTVVTRSDDGKNSKESKYHTPVEILDIKIEENATVIKQIEKENGNLVLVIREPNLVNGETRKYTIKYKYSLGYDRINEYDEFYYNLLFTDFSMPVKNYSFEINLPKPFSQFNPLNEEQENKPRFMFGKAGSTNAPNDNVFQYEINENKTKISGKFLTTIAPYNGLTIRLMLEENYFNEVQKFNNVYDILLITLTVLLFVLAIVMYVLYANKKQVVKTVEFYPPNEMDPIELLYVLKGIVPIKQLSSLIVYFASKNYLKIIDDNGDLSLQKLKELEKDAPPYQKIIFDGIFEKAKKVPVKNLDAQTEKEINKKLKENDNKSIKYLPLELSEIEQHSGQSFLSASQTIRTTLGSRVQRKSILKMLTLLAIAIIPTILLIVLYFVRIKLLDFVLMLIIPAVFVVLSLAFMTMNNPKIFESKTGKQTKSIVFSLTVLIIGFILFSFSVFEENVVMSVLPFVVFAHLAFSIMITPSMLQLNSKYHDLYGRCLGFKKNLVLVEKKRIEVLLKDNPSYFYDILPYAYVLGISNEFIKNFEGLTIAQPNWYVSYSGSTLFDIYIFNSLMNTTMSSVGKSIATSTMSSKGFGGFSGGGGIGGGFSGGGFGGGGIGGA